MDKLTNMKAKLFKTMLCAGMAGTLLTGCMDDNVYNPDATKKQFEQNWKKEFGEIDPNQTWNTATRVTAKVAIGYEGNYTVEFYTENPRKKDVKAYLLGEFEVKGGETSSLQFDVPSTQETVYVALVDEDSGRIIKDVNIENREAAIVFGQNNTTTKSVTSGSGMFKIEDNGYLEYETSLVSVDGGFLKIIPENTCNIDNSGTTQYRNFLYKASKKFIIQPVYTVTSANLSLGIYWYDSAGTKQEQIIWSYSDRASFQGLKEDNSWEGGWKYNEEFWLGTWGRHTKFKSESMIVTPPSGGVTFGFFATNGSSKFYTEAELNKIIPGDFLSIQRATTFNLNGERYLGFEDGTDFDMNDLVLHFPELDTPDIVDKDNPSSESAQPWILACEDLGSTDDFDFNDVVFKVEHAAGSKTATVTPLAAGGVLAAEIYYGEKSIGEIHQMLGASGLTMTNTTNRGNAGASQTIDVPDGFSMTNNMGNFKIKIKGKDGKEAEVTIVNAPQDGEAPQMICIDGSTDWAWPSERTKISDAYPRFGEWGANYTTDKDWYNQPVLKSDSGHLNIVQ